MRPCCERVVKDLLPAFRSLLAKELIDKYNFSQKEAAEKIGTTRVAVTQYLSSKRGGKTKQLENISLVQSSIKKMAKELANGSLTLDKTEPILCNICEALKVNDFVCGPKKGKNTIPEEECEISYYI